jgi:hypothetical protein
MGTQAASVPCTGLPELTGNLTCIGPRGSDNLLILSYIYLGVFSFLTIAIVVIILVRPGIPTPTRAQQDTFDPRDGSNITRIPPGIALEPSQTLGPTMVLSSRRCLHKPDLRHRWEMQGGRYIAEGVPLLMPCSVRVA